MNNHRLPAPFGRALAGSAVRWPRALREHRRRPAVLPEPELWTEMAEPYAGATVLRDLPASTGDVHGTGVILARFAVARLLEPWGPAAPANLLADERNAARAHLTLLGRKDPERRMLGDLLALAGEPANPRALAAAMEAAAAAAHRGQPAGAFALLRAVYRLGLESGQRDAARTAAETIAAHAAAAGARRSQRLWRRRAARLRPATA